MSIPQDDTSTGLDDNDAIAILSGQLTPDKGTPPSNDEDDEELDDDQEDLEDDEEDFEDDDQEDLDDDDDEEDEEDDEDEEEDEEEAAPAPEVSDDTVLKITVDGEEQEVSIGSLKRLAGQEASLTRKSQEADVVGQRAAATIQGSLELVLEDLQAYDEVDWVLEGQRMDPEEFQWHREQFTKLSSRRDKLIQGAQNLEQTVKARRHSQLQEQATDAIKVLSDPKTGIEGWSDELYTDIMTFAIEEAGLPEAEVAQIVNPSVIKLINDARLYRKGQKAGAKKLNLTPRKTRKGAGGEPLQGLPSKRQKSLERKMQSGRATDDDAIALLVGRWGNKGP